VVDAAVPLPVLHGDPRLNAQLRGAARAVLRQVLPVPAAVGVPPVLPGEPLFLGQDGTSLSSPGSAPPPPRTRRGRPPRSRAAS
jgi:hypothetical protein